MGLLRFCLWGMFFCAPSKLALRPRISARTALSSVCGAARSRKVNFCPAKANNTFIVAAGRERRSSNSSKKTGPVGPADPQAVWQGWGQGAKYVRSAKAVHGRGIEYQRPTSSPPAAPAAAEVNCRPALKLASSILISIRHIARRDSIGSIQTKAP